MIHPAYFIIFSIIQAIALLTAVAYGFRVGYAAYAKKEPPPAIIIGGTPKEDELPEPVSPSRQRRERQKQEVS